MKKIYRLCIAFLFAGVIVANAGPSLSEKGGVVSNPSPNPTVFTTSNTCNTSGYFSGPAGEGWIRVIVTAYTCYKDGNKIPGLSIFSAASTLWDVSSISASRGWACADHNITFTATTNPTGYESYVTWTNG